MIALAAVTAVVSIIRRSHLPRALLPFAIYALAMCVLQVGNQNLKPLYFVSLLPPLALLSAVWIVDACSATNPRIRLVGRAVAAAAALALVFTVQQTLQSRDRSNPNGELIKSARTRRGPGSRERAHVAGRQSCRADARLLSA